jgi:hypothetical protein
MTNEPLQELPHIVSAALTSLTVIRVEPGHEEPEGEDHVTITPRQDGGYEFSGTVSIHSEDVEPGSSTSTSGIVGADGPFATAEAAEAAAIEWAAEQGAETLYVLLAE